MSCTSCSSGKDGTPAGCQSNGSCGTGGCNKLNVYNWLADMSLPSGQNPFNIVEVRFKGTRKEFYKNIENLPLQEGDVVAVESSPGHDIGVVSMTGELVRFQLKKKKIQIESDEIKAIYRKGKPVDIEKWQAAQALEDSTMHRARSIAQSLKLSMKISDVEFQGDMKKAAFFYTADDRVDFRELIKKLAEEFKVRIEMKQIGMRQEAGRLGGIGSCGRELCCSTWLTDFRSVSTSAARYQNLSLNPLKLAGQCGKLKCCLNYELDSYMDALKDFPDINIALHTEKGVAMHRKTDLFKRMMWYAYVSGSPRVGDKRERGGDKRDSDVDDTPESSNWFMMPLERVREIIDMNKQNKKPADLVDFSQVVKEPVLDFENVVGQDSITRLDHKKSKNKKKKKKKTPDNELTTGGDTTPRPREAAQTDGPRPQARPDQNRRPAPNQQRPNQQVGQRQSPASSPNQPAAAEKTNNAPPRQSPGPNPRQSPAVNPRQSPPVAPKTEQQQSPKPPIVQTPMPSEGGSKPNIAPRTSPGTRPPRESPKKDNNENSGA